MTETADKSGVIAMAPRKADGFLSRSIGDETIIVPVRGGVGDLDAAVSAEYEVTPEAARGDVDRFLQTLAERGLLAGPPAPGEPPR